MMRGCQKYLIAFFLISIFLLHGAGSLFPSVFAPGNKAVIELFTGFEQEKSKESTEEKSTESIKEPYLHHAGLKASCPEPSVKSGKRMIAPEFICKYSVCMAIPTPPPELFC